MYFEVKSLWKGEVGLKLAKITLTLLQSNFTLKCKLVTARFLDHLQGNQNIQHYRNKVP